MDQTRIDERYYNESTYFDRASHLRDLDSPFQRYRVRKVLEIYQPGAGDRVLDLGCGWGTITFALGSLVKEVVGLDFSEKAIEACRARLAEATLDGEGGNVAFQIGDARRTAFEDGSFDVIVAADLYEHLYPDDSEFVSREAARLLRPGGRLLVWTPCRSHVLEVLKNRDIILKRDESHVDYKSMERMKGLLTDAGFQIERAYYAESHLPGLRFLERHLQRWAPLLRRRIAVLARKPAEHPAPGSPSGGGGAAAPSGGAP